jgi:hypothetical protein
MAIVFVTYGKKYNVCKNLCNTLIEFKATEINNENAQVLIKLQYDGKLNDEYE